MQDFYIYVRIDILKKIISCFVYRSLICFVLKYFSNALILLYININHFLIFILRNEYQDENYYDFIDKIIKWLRTTQNAQSC